MELCNGGLMPVVSVIGMHWFTSLVMCTFSHSGLARPLFLVIRAAMGTEKETPSGLGISGLGCMICHI